METIAPTPSVEAPAAPEFETSSLPEFKRYRPKPGHPDWARLAAEARALAAEFRSSLARPETKGARLRRQLAAFKTTGQNYLVNRRKARAGRGDLLPLYFIWTTTRACNFLCTYCDDHQGRKYPELPNRGVLDTQRGRELLKVMRTRTPSVYFAGGEPTSRKDLPELTRAARDLNYYPIIINTNGSLVERNLRKAEWATWLADTDIIIVSLDTLDVASASKMWVYEKSLDVYRNLLLLRELAKEMNFKLMVNAVIQPGHVDEARDVLDFANDMGIWFAPVPQNVGPRVHDELRDDQAYGALVETIMSRKREGALITGSQRMNRRLLNSEPLTCRNTLKPHVDFDGKVAWPCKACVNVKPEYIDVLAHQDVDDLYAAATKVISPTGFHGQARNQCGADCNWAQNYTTDTYAHGLLHPTSLLADISEFLRAR